MPASELRKGAGHSCYRRVQRTSLRSSYATGRPMHLFSVAGFVPSVKRQCVAEHPEAFQDETVVDSPACKSFVRKLGFSSRTRACFSVSVQRRNFLRLFINHVPLQQPSSSPSSSAVVLRVALRQKLPSFFQRPFLRSLPDFISSIIRTECVPRSG